MINLWKLARRRLAGQPSDDPRAKVWDFIILLFLVGRTLLFYYYDTSQFYSFIWTRVSCASFDLELVGRRPNLKEQRHDKEETHIDQP